MKANNATAVGTLAAAGHAGTKSDPLALLAPATAGGVEPVGVGETLKLPLIQPADQRPVHRGQLHRLIREGRVKVADIQRRFLQINMRVTSSGVFCK